MLDETRLIEALRQARAQPPAAPPDEWFAVARRTVNAAPRRGRALAWGLGVAVACLLLALPLLRPVAGTALPRAQAAVLSPAEELDQALDPLKASAMGQEDDNASAPGGEMLVILDAV